MVTTFRRHLSLILQVSVCSSAGYILDIICISFLFAAITGYHKLSGLEQHKLVSYNSRGQNFENDFSGLTSAVSRAVLLSGGVRGT